MRPPSLQAELSSVLAQSGLTLRNGRVTPHKKEPSGTPRLCSVAAWRILAEVFRTRSMEGRPQGGGSSYHLRWEELGVVMGAKDIRCIWLRHGSTLSYISYQPCKNPLRSYKISLCPNSGLLYCFSLTFQSTSACFVLWGWNAQTHKNSYG